MAVPYHTFPPSARPPIQRAAHGPCISNSGSPCNIAGERKFVALPAAPLESKFTSIMSLRMEPGLTYAQQYQRQCKIACMTPSEKLDSLDSLQKKLRQFGREMPRSMAAVNSIRFLPSGASCMFAHFLLVCSAGTDRRIQPAPVPTQAKGRKNLFY